MVRYRLNPLPEVPDMLMQLLQQWNPLIDKPCKLKECTAVTIDEWLSNEFIITDEDLRETKLVRKKVRQDQDRFRKALMNLYGPRCMITGQREERQPSCIVEAAHIKPYRGPHDNHIENGLLLRVDLHRLFDRDLIGFNPRNLHLEIHDALKGSVYENYVGVALNTQGYPVSRVALQKRYDEFLKNKEVRIYRRNATEELFCQNTFEKYHDEVVINNLKVPASGLKIITYGGSKYKLLITSKREAELPYYHTILDEDGCYQLLLPESVLLQYEVSDNSLIFRSFRMLFMGDRCLDPYLDKRISKPTGPQVEAVRYGNQYSKGFLNSYYDGDRAGLLTLPTGMGKTQCAAKIYQLLSKYVEGRVDLKRVLFISHQKYHVINAEATFKRLTPELAQHTGFLFSESLGLKKVYPEVHKKIYRPTKLKECVGVFAVINSLAKNLKEFDPDEFDLIIVDEAHRAGARPRSVRGGGKVEQDLSKSSMYQSVLSYFRPKYLLGLTATPFRSDYSENVPEIFGKEGYKKGDGNIIYRMSPSEGADLARGITDGYLSQVEYWIINDVTKYEEYIEEQRPDLIEEASAGKKRLIQKEWNHRIKEIKQNYEQIILWESLQKHLFENGRFLQSVVFCRNTAHALRLYEYFSKTQHILQSGVIADCMFVGREKAVQDGQDSDIILDKFRKGQINLIFAVNMLDEGIDIPQIRGIAFLGKTASPVKQIQRLGRGLRLAPEKRQVKVLDYESNYSDLHYLINIGLPEQIKRTRQGKVQSQNGRLSEREDWVEDLDFIKAFNVKTEWDDALVELIEAGRYTISRVAPELVDEAKRLRAQGFSFKGIQEELTVFAKQQNLKPASVAQYRLTIWREVENITPISREAKLHFIDELFTKYQERGTVPLNYIAYATELDEATLAEEYLTESQYTQSKLYRWDPSTGKVEQISPRHRS